MTPILAALFAVLASFGAPHPSPAPSLDEAQVRAIVGDMLKQQQMEQTASLDRSSIDSLVEDYLLGHPEILDRMNQKLAETKLASARQQMRAELAMQKSAIYDDPGNVVLGNPKGDVTLVEMFDYNCSYCRGALPDMATLLATDPNLRVILRQFPILSKGSVDAARIAALVAKDSRIKYWDFHQALFSARGEVDVTTALNVAEKLGGNRVELMLDMNGTGPTATIQRSYDLAKALNVTGTPTYILGDEVIAGVIDLDELKAKIANVRACGSTSCPAAG